MDRHPRRRTLVIATLVFACLCIGRTASAAQRYDPRLRFRVLVTERFDIYHHQGAEAMARRLAAVAHDVARTLDGSLGRPSHRVGIILVDQTDLANGWATPVPYDLIEMTAVAPPGSSIIGNTDDWMRLVFTHEYTHILHLDKSRGWIGGLRRVFGRSPILFPNLFLPTWQIEGIATYQESAGTPQGRVRAGDARAIVQVATGAGRFLPLDRASNSLVDWPSGNAPYVYGGLFHQYLADRFGADALARLRDETAGRLPYFGAPAFKKVFNRSLGDLWSDFEADSRRGTSASAPPGKRLTNHGFTVTAPVFTSDGRLFYSVVNPHGFPALMEHRPDRQAGRQVTTRFLGNRLSSAGDLLVFDQLEYTRNVGLHSDLYAASANSGDVRRLTRGARAADPDVAGDGRTIVCTVQATDRRMLATMTMPVPGQFGVTTALVSEEGTEFYSPRWSPDGRSIVAERRRRGQPYEIVVIDKDTKEVRTLFATRTGRPIAPTWLRDGREILFSWDAAGAPFALMRLDVASGQVRRAASGSGAHSAALSPDGRTVVFVGYTVEGDDLYSVPFEQLRWEELAEPAADATAAVAPEALTGVDAAVESYGPWKTLRPRFWTPVVESDQGEWIAGAGTGGMDALGRHAYAGSVAWSTSRARPDVLAAYVYDRWRPTLFAQISDDTDPFEEGEIHSVELDAGALFPVRRARWVAAAFAGLHGSTDTLDCSACDRPRRGTADRRAVRAGLSVDNSRRYGYSISDEQGGSAQTTIELARRAFGDDGDTGAMVADVRWYLRARPRHGAIALRLSGAFSWGDAETRRRFSASGSGPQAGGFDVGFDAIGLLRGFDESDVIGDRAAVLNVDYRFPLRHVERGFGTLPLFLRNLHGALFADAGNAWTNGFRRSDVRRAFGAELSADAVVGYVLPLTVTGGAAWRDDPVSRARGWAVFGRVGRAF